MKRYILIITIILFSFLGISKVNALSGYTTGTNVMVRKGPGVSYEAIGKYSNKGSVLDLVSEEVFNSGDTSCSSGWYKINYDGQVGYLCGVYVSIGEKSTTTEKEYYTDSYDARINGVNIYVRTKASSSGTVVDKLLPGTNIKITSDKISGTGCSEGYYKVTYYKNQTGYVCSKYIVTKSEITSSNSEYESYLKNLGFSDGYIPYLVKLHELHPNWEFKPLLTNLSWNEVLDGFNGKTALLNYKIDAYIVSDNDNIDGSGWYQVKPSVVAFYLDPRNFLTEKFVFMFESLRYDYGNDSKDNLDLNSESSKKYLKAISSVLSNTYLDTDEYKEYFIEAGFLNNVSPVHLTTRSKGEGAANENYVAVSGNNPDLYGIYNINGYYNYYNIYAYLGAFTPTSTYNSPVKNGLIYACGSNCGVSNTYGRPWDTRKKAIVGGAQFISSSYISKGQFSIYLQRFNVNPSSTYSLYTHNYQTNVLAQCSDAAESYTSYKDMGLLNENYTFEIPVFNEMPEVTSLPSIASTVNTIESISINGKKITNFDKDILEFTSYVNKSDKEYNIEVELSDKTSSVSGSGVVTFDENEKLIELKVTSESGDIRVYKMTLVKVSDTTTIEDIISNLAVKENNGILYDIKQGTLISTMISSINKYSPGTTITFNESDGSAVSASGVLKTGIVVKLVTPSGETKSFKIAVRGDVSGDGEITILDLLKVQKHLLKASILKDEYLIAADNNADNDVTILDLLRIQKYLLKVIDL